MPALNQDGLEIVDTPANLNADGFEIVEPSPRPAFNPITTAERLAQAPYDFRPVSPEGWTPKAEREFRMSVLPTPEQEATAGQGLAGAMSAGARRAGATGFGELAMGAAPATRALEVASSGADFPIIADWQTGEVRRRTALTPAQELQDIRQQPAYRFGESLAGGAQEAFPVAPEQENRFLVKTSEAAGGLVPLVASGPLAPVTITLQSLGGHLNNDFEQLKSEGMSEDEAAKATLNRALRSGVAAGTIFTFLPAPLRKAGDKYLIDKFGETALKRFVAARAAGAAEGAVLMPAAHAAENVISGRPPTEGLGESAVAGALMIAPMKRGLTETERAFEPGLAPPPAALADAQARAAARPGEYDWQGFTQPARPSRLTPQIGVPAARPPAAYEFATPTETRNEPAPINEPVPVEPGPLRQFPALSQPVELGGKRYEKRGAIWFENPRAADGGTPIFRDSSEGRNLISELERKLTGAAKPPPAYDLEPVVVHADSPDAVLQKAAQRVLYGTGAVEVYSPQGVQLPLGNYLRDIAERRRLGLPLEKTSIAEQLDALRKGKPSARTEPTTTEMGLRREGGGMGPKAPLRQPGPPPEAGSPPAPPVAPTTPPAPPAVKLTVADLEPALRVRGQKPLTGGWNHEAIMMANADNPDVVQAFGQDSNHIFVDKQGNEYTRAQAAEKLGLKEPLNSETLRGMQGIPKPKVGKPVAKKSKTPKVADLSDEDLKRNYAEYVAKLLDSGARGEQVPAEHQRITGELLDEINRRGIPITAPEEGKKLRTAEAAKPGPPLSKEQTDIIAKLESLKIKPKQGPRLYSLPHPDAIKQITAEVWNDAIDFAIKTVKIGRSVKAAIDDAISYIRAITSNEFDEARLRANFESAFGVEPAAPVAPPEAPEPAELPPAKPTKPAIRGERGRLVGGLLSSPRNQKRLVQGLYAASAAERERLAKDPEYQRQLADAQQKAKDRAAIETPQVLPPAEDPAFSFRTWINKFIEESDDRPKTKERHRNTLAAIAKVWPSLLDSDMRKLTPTDFRTFVNAVFRRHERQKETKMVLPGETKMSHAFGKFALQLLRKGYTKLQKDHADVTSPLRDFTEGSFEIPEAPEFKKLWIYPKVSRIVSFFKAIPDSSVSEHRAMDREVANLYAVTGLRAAELGRAGTDPTQPEYLGLKLGEIDLQNREINLARKRTKQQSKEQLAKQAEQAKTEGGESDDEQGGGAIVTSLSQDAADFIADYIRRHHPNGKPEDELVPGLTEGSRKILNSVLKHAAKQAGINNADRFRIAVLRKWYATNARQELLASGKNQEEADRLVSDALGNTPQIMRDKYLLETEGAAEAGRAAMKARRGGMSDELKAVFGAPPVAEPPKKPVAGRRMGDKESRGERPFDLIDAAAAHAKKISWKLIKQADPDWEPVGAAREIFAAEGEPADTAATALHREGYYRGDPNQMDQFGDAMNAAANARKTHRQVKSKESAAQDELEAQRMRFEAELVNPAAGTEPLDLDRVFEGTKFKYRGVEFTVRRVDIDADGRVVGLRLEDGDTYGTQDIFDTKTLGRLRTDSQPPIPPGPAASRQSGQLTPAEAREYTALRRLDQAGTLPDRLRPRLDELAARGVVGDLAPEATGGRLKPGEFRETLKLEGEQVKAPKPSPQLDLFASTTIAKPSYQDPPIDQSEIPKAFRPEDAAGFPVRVMRASELESKLIGLGYPEAEARDVARTSSGLFLPDTREIVLISDAIPQSERGKIAAVVREEAGHGLLRSLDANRMLAKILADGKLQLTEAERAPLRELGYEDWQHLDEFIAKSAAENLPWWKAAVEQVRVWLSKVGLANLTNAEVSRMLVKELRRLNAQGTVSTEESPFGGIAASRTKDEDLYGKMMGIDRAAGPLPNDPAAIGVKKIIRENLEKDATWSTAGAPTPEKTAQVWETLKSLMSLPTAEGKLQQLSDAAAQGAPDNMRYAISQMAGGQYVRGAFHYALRLAAQRRDPSLLYFIGERYNEINTTTGPQAPRGLGRAFNALQAGEADPLFRSWLALLDAADDVKLSGKDKLRQLVQIMHEHGDIIEEISKKGPDEIVPAAREELRKKALTPELAWLRQYQDALESYNTEWKKPAYRKTLLADIKALIKRFETTQPFARAVADNGAGFRSTLSDLLFDKVVQSIEVENARREKINEERRQKDLKKTGDLELDEEGTKDIPLIDLEDPDLIAVLRRQMEDLSSDIWHKKLAKEGDWNAAARNLDEQWTKATLDKWEREQTDWLKPTKERSRAQKEVESFLDLPPFENTDAERKVRVDALRAKLESAGVLPNTAWAMADAAWNRKLRNESNEHLRQIQREQQRIWNESEGVARSLIAGMQNLQTSNTVRNRVRELVTQALRIRPTSDDIAKLGALEASRQIEAISKEPSQKLIEELTKPMAEGGGGLDEATARELATLVATKREFMWRSANRQAMERAANSQRLAGLMEAILASPHQAQSDPTWRFTTARDWFISNGLSKTEAAEAARIFAAEFNTRLDEAAKKVAERVLAGFNFDRPTKLSVVQAVRSGLMDPNKPWWAEFAEKGGLKLPTDAQLKKLAELDERLSKLQPDEEFDITEINSQMSQIFRQLQPPPKFWNLIAANFVVAPLTGIRTLTIQAGPWFWQPYEALLTSLTRPHDLANTWKPVIDGFRGMISQFRFGMSADAHSFLANKFGGAVNELEHLWKTGLEDVKNKNPLIRSRGLLKMLTGGQMFSMRALDSFDQASGVMLRYGLMLRYGQSVFRNAGMDSRDIRNLSEFARAVHHAKYLDLVNGRPDEGIPPETHVRASVHADQFTTAQVQEFMVNKLTEHLESSIEPNDPARVQKLASAMNTATVEAQKARDAAEFDARQAIGRLGEGVREEEEGGVMSRLFLHPLLKVSSQLRRGTPQERILAVALLGYLNIPIRTARYFAWNSPYGLARLGIHGYRQWRGFDNWWKQSLANEHMVQYRLRQALAATALQAAITATGIAYFGQSSSADDNGKKNGFFITGQGPKNAAVRDAWLKVGFRPYSIMLFHDGKPATVPLMRLGEPLSHLFILLSALDDYNWRKKEKEATGKPFNENAIQSAGYLIGNYIGALGQRGLIYTTARLTRAAGSEGGAAKVAADIVSGAVANATPFIGMQRSILGMMMGQVDQSSIQSTIESNFPIFGALGITHQAVNRFGDPLGNRTWYAKMADTGVPIAFQVADNDENHRLYMDMVQKGVGPPTLRRAIIEEKYGQLTDSEWSTFAQRSGDLLKKTTLANLSTIERQSPADAKKTLSGFAATADNIAARGLGLETVATAKTGGGGVSLPSSSGASGGLLGGGAGLLGGGGGILSGGGGRLLGGSRAGGLGGGGGGLRAARTTRVRSVGLRRRSVTRRLRIPRRSLGGSRSRRRLLGGLRRPRMRRLRLA